MRPVQHAAVLFFCALISWVALMVEVAVRFGGLAVAMFGVGSALVFLFAFAWAAVAHGDTGAR